MKYILTLLALGILGCGDESQGSGATGGLSYTQDGQPIYTLEDHYRVRLNGLDVVFWGIQEAFGEANNQASLVNVTDWNHWTACGLRMIVKKVDLTVNDYTMKIGASDQDGEGCGQFRGNYTMTLTGPDTADITWINEDDITF